MICMNLKDKTLIKRIIESYLIAFALMNVCGQATTNIFTVIFFLLAFALLGKKLKAEGKKDYAISAVTSNRRTYQ